MKTTIYKCDKCGAEDTINKIGILNVGVYVGNYAYHIAGHKETYNKEWCLSCREKMGMVKADKVIPGSPPPPPPATLEDIIREIMYEVAQDVKNNG